MPTPIVISASRRTDIPAFYMDWFMRGIETGYFRVKNPFNQAVSIVPAAPDAVHTIVFISKNYGRFIEGNYGERLAEMGYHLFFNFTLNSEAKLLEPNLPPLMERIEQARELARLFGPETVQWRFDPICFYRDGNGRTGNNLGDFMNIAEKLAGFGIRRCITSFADIYAKVKTRTAKMDDFEFIDPPMATKVRVVEKMAARLKNLGISLYTCCEKDLIDALPESTTVRPSACIPNRYLVELFGGALSYRKDSGQRGAKGCGCNASRDIGDYDAHPCFHNCLYCYANPAEIKRIQCPTNLK